MRTHPATSTDSNVTVPPVSMTRQEPCAVIQSELWDL